MTCCRQSIPALLEASLLPSLPHPFVIHLTLLGMAHFDMIVSMTHLPALVVGDCTKQLT